MKAFVRQKRSTKKTHKRTLTKNEAKWMNSCICTCISRAIRDFDAIRIDKARFQIETNHWSCFFLRFSLIFIIWQKSGEATQKKQLYIEWNNARFAWNGNIRDSTQRPREWSVEMKRRKKSITMKSLIWKGNGKMSCAHYHAALAMQWRAQGNNKKQSQLPMVNVYVCGASDFKIFFQVISLVWLNVIANRNWMDFETFKCPRQESLVLISRKIECTLRPLDFIHATHAIFTSFDAFWMKFVFKTTLPRPFRLNYVFSMQIVRFRNFHSVRSHFVTKNSSAEFEKPIFSNGVFITD